MKFEFKRSTRVYACLLIAGLGAATVFNNCGKFASSSVSLDSNAAGTSLSGPSGSTGTSTPPVTTDVGTTGTGSGTPTDVGTTGSGSGATTMPPATSPPTTPVTPPPGADDVPKALSLDPSAVSVDPYGTASILLAGGTKPYKITGDFTADIPASTLLEVRTYLPGVTTLSVSDSAGAMVTAKITTTGDLRVVVAYVDPVKTDSFTFDTYTYSTDLGQGTAHAGVDKTNGFPVYAAPAPPRTHAIYACENVPGRQFLTADPACEGRKVLGLLGYLYDAADSLPGFKLLDITRTYNGAANLHRQQTSTETPPAGFKLEGVLGYLPPRMPSAWCGVYARCL